MSTQALKDKITAVIKRNIDDANAYYKRMLPMPDVDFSLRGTCAGRANVNNWVVKVNQILLDENEDEMVNVTIPHEVAHLVDFKINPENFRSSRLTGRKRSLHGPTFKHILGHVLGCHDTSTTHTMDTTNARTRQRVRHTWNCTCGASMDLGPKQHNKMRFNNEAYRPRGKGCKRRHPMHLYSYAGQHNPDAPKKLIAPKPIVKEYQMAAHDATDTSIPTEVVVIKPTSHKRPTTGTKKERAKVIFAVNSVRKDFIARCVAELDMTKAGASTYHSNFKKGTW